MIKKSEKIVLSLKILHEIQTAEGGVIFHSSLLSRLHRERLIKHGFLYEIMKGWLMITDPSSKKGESTIWYASFWSFLKIYLEKRFKNDYCLSPEASLQLHLGATVIPKQVTIMTKRTSNQMINLPHSTTLLLYKEIQNFPKKRVHKNGVWVMEIEEALCRLSPSFFEQYSLDAELALRSIRNPSKLLSYLLEGGHSTVAGRLIGAYTFLGEKQMATLIKATMISADYTPKVENPFLLRRPILNQGFLVTSPYSARIESTWLSMREEVLKHFPAEPGLPQNHIEHLQKLEDVYVNDAYNSLSIEGYQVTPELIEQIQKMAWNPDKNTSDIQQRDAMAAKGYYMAFQAVKKSISAILEGQNAGQVISNDLPLWYLELFSPMVLAGLLKPHQLSGYRDHPVYIRQSMHVPPPASALIDSMEIYNNLLIREESSAVRAILGHFMFVYIHPYGDGNGRLGRFIMNCMLASGGFPWCVIPMTQRTRYVTTLEEASCQGSIKGFCEFIREVSGI